jgi:hypothetical protein
MNPDEAKYAKLDHDFWLNASGPSEDDIVELKNTGIVVCVLFAFSSGDQAAKATDS